MMGKNHLKTNVSLLCLYTGSQAALGARSIGEMIPYYDLPTTPVDFVVFALAVVIGSMLPDIDLFPPLRLILGHRRITHTLWMVLLIGSGIYFTQGLWQLFFIGLTISYALHILADYFSVQGVDLFWPIGPGYIVYSGGATVRKGHTLKLYKVGSDGEKLFVNILSVLGLVSGCFTLYVLFLTQWF